MFDNFIKRIIHLLDGRKPSPWGQSIGLSSALTARMMQGNIPGALILSTIRRAENVSMSWLLEGKGTAYIVNHTDSDLEAFDRLKMFIEDEDEWHIHDIRNKENQSQQIIVLTQPGEYNYEQRGKQTTLNYTIVEIISGPLGKRVYEFLKKKKCSHVVMPHDKFTMLGQGWIGNYELLESVNKKGLLSTYKILDLVREDPDWSYYVVNNSSEEKRLSGLFRQLDTIDQDALIRIAEALSERKKIRT